MHSIPLVKAYHCRSWSPGSRRSLTPSEFADWTACTVATKADVENHFNTHGTGEITEIKLMNGFGFIEYKDAMDARDVVPGTSPGHPYCHLIVQVSHHRI